MRKFMLKRSVALVVLTAAACARSGSTLPGRAADAARAADLSGNVVDRTALQRRLAAFSHDSMQGRNTGEPGGRRAADFLAAEVARLGLRPAGDDGFLQTVRYLERRPSRNPLIVAGTSFTPLQDFGVLDLGPQVRSVDGVQVVFGGKGEDLITAEQAAGKLVVLVLGGALDFERFTALTSSRFAAAAGIALAGTFAPTPPVLELLTSRRAFDGDTAAPATAPIVLLLGARISAALFGAPLSGGSTPATGASLGVIRGDVRPRFEPIVTYNVAAVLPGSDPAVRGQYVAFGAHLDHLGISSTPVDHDSLRAVNGIVRPFGVEDAAKQPTAADLPRIRATLDSLRRLRPARRDSIANGADDDGSGSIALVGIAEAFARGARPRRSLLFVWHSGEEKGLVGSRWYTDHPTVPLDSIVAQLNTDMVGRGTARDLPNGGPGYLQLIGTRRLSTELGDMVERVNTQRRLGFTFDYSSDTDGNPRQYYCRSDHFMYARYGIPIAFFSTGGHRDYHMVTDEVEYIDFDKFGRVAQLIHDVGAEVANLDHRVVVDKPKPDPRAACRQ